MINKEFANKFKDLISKADYVPKALYPEGLTLMVIDAVLGPKIAKLRLEGYSDEEIIKLLEEDEA